MRESYAAQPSRFPADGDVHHRIESTDGLQHWVSSEPVEVADDAQPELMRPAISIAMTQLEEAELRVRDLAAHLLDIGAQVGIYEASLYESDDEAPARS